MSRRYLLDSSIVFFPDTYEFRDYSSLDKVNQLNQPASRCLELLIERAPDLVVQRDFYEFVWGEAASTVQLNTLYQNISLLRRSLKSYGYNYADMVLTVPRKGFKFNEKFSIQQLKEDGEELEGIANSVGYRESDNMSVQIAADTSVNEEIIESLQITSPSKKNHLFLVNTVLVVILCIELLWLFVVNRDTIPSFGLEHYANNEKISDCLVYSLNDQLTITEAGLKSARVDCKSHPNLYVKHDLFSSENTLIACDKPFKATTSPDCITYHLIEGK